VAQERLQIRLDAVDNTRRAFNSFQSRLDKIKSSIFNVKNALLGIGAGAVIKGFVDAGIQIENLGVQLKALFGSAKAGKQALKVVTDFATKTPFELSNIQQGVVALATVRKTAEKAGVTFEELLKITGNTAVQLGGDFALASQQIQRAFSGGISASDLFRDRGVSAMAGFEIGTRYSIDQTIKRLRKAFGTGGEFGDLIEELSKTLSGTVSNLKDAFFTFQVAVSAGFFGELKSQLGDLKKFIEDNDATIKRFGVSVGQGLSRAIITLSNAVKYVFENFEVFKNILLAIVAIKIGKFLIDLALIFKGLIVLVGRLTAVMMLNPLIATATLVAGGIALVTSQLGKQKDEVNDLRDAWEALNSEIPAVGYETTKGSTGIDKLIMPQAKPVGFGLPTDEEGGAIDVKTIIEANSAIKQFEDTIRKINEDQMTKLNEAWLNIGETLAKGIYGSIDAISKSLAEAIILGKDLGQAFKQFVQNAIVNALSALISFVLQKLFLYALEKLFGIEIKKEIDLEKQKLNTMKQQTKELGKQVALKAILMFMGGFAEGGRVNGSRAEGGRVNGYRANGGQTSGTNAYIVGERGRELFIPSTDGQIVSNENLKTMGGANITFNINATDVKGVKELLIDNRATITNIINSALNQKGKPALV
jgi:hypothetical protein